MEYYTNKMLISKQWSYLCGAFLYTTNCCCRFCWERCEKKNEKLSSTYVSCKWSGSYLNYCSPDSAIANWIVQYYW